MCEARGVPVLRIGVTDATSGTIEIQDVATLSLDELRAANRAPIRGRFA
jgi:phosphoribosylformylglycinamidine synthase